MHPDLEFFLEDVFDSIQPAIPGIGRVIVEPDYDAEPDDSEKDALRSELIQFIEGHPASGEVGVPAGQGVLSKYVRRVTLKRDKLQGAWVEVAPPGNWI
jgi:hypothetical protein